MNPCHGTHPEKLKSGEKMVGGTRFELVTPTMSSARENAKPLNPKYFK